MPLAHLLLRQACQRPDSPALLNGTEPHATHREWAARSAGLAERLRAAGLVPGERVLLFARNHPRYLEVLWGLWWAGLVAVPVNCTPPSATAATDSRPNAAPIVGSPAETRAVR